MNRITRNLVAAAPLAIMALTVVPASAMAAPGDLTTPPVGPTPPKGPGDLTTPPVGPTPPTGPGDLTTPPPCPTHGECGSGGDDTPGDDTPDGGGFDVPTRVDAGIASEGSDDTALSWVLASGAVVIASGAAFGAKRQRRTA